MTQESPLDLAHQTVFEAGLAVRREVLGAEYVDGAMARSAGTDGEELQKFVSEFVWGGAWTRPGLDRRSRSLINLGMLIALSQPHELSVHVRVGLSNGLTRGEITEAVIHATAYVGVPLGMAAMRVVQETLTAELGPLTAEVSV
ncbi:carboxymuconolactone decarboxylase family protein [Rhodococcus sp. KBS0724]|uniref:carboxymuconolactone decarboxylase family protein n=1 Tax=Rhodococcus sp. KBS0724 TaxID=1179674 RepID=UPI0021B0E846|nr:carboxymuconolactone decarboxylase family protein [Rhodococcus sp. KBS0724]